MHFKRRPDHGRPLSHPGQAVAVGVHGGGIEADAVVPDHQVNPVVAEGQAHGHLSGGGVTLHVGQGLLGDAEQRLGFFVRQIELLASHSQVGLDAGPRLESLVTILSRSGFHRAFPVGSTGGWTERGATATNSQNSVTSVASQPDVL